MATETQSHRDLFLTKNKRALCISVTLCLVHLLCGSAASLSPLVHVGRLDVHHFKSRALKAERLVRVWLPEKPPRGVRYSVLYLNDGQNLFGDGDPNSGGGGWHVDEAAPSADESAAVRALHHRSCGAA